MKGGQNSSGRLPRSLTAVHLPKTKVSHLVFELTPSRAYLPLKWDEKSGKRDYHKSIYIEITELKLKIFGKTKYQNCNV